MRYLPLSAYGAIGNDDRVALVSRNGSVDWCCFPHLESSSVFARILDFERGGHFTIQPTAEFDVEQQYVDRTNILKTTFQTEEGTVTLTDFMPTPIDDPPDERYQQAIYRQISCESEPVEMELTFAPRFDYARADTTVERAGDAVVARGNGEKLVLRGDIEIEANGDEAAATVTLDTGETRCVGVQYEHDVALSKEDIRELLRETKQYWREWLEQCEETNSVLFEGPWGTQITRSALVLKLLIHQETGAIPAAATTSIPEEIGGERNWDYRFNWIRDAKFTVQSLYNIGQTQEAEAYFEWFLDVADDDPAKIQPIYGLHGETDLTEEILDHLSGYRNTSPVRIGNAAATQQQLDVYGTIVEGIYETIRHDGDLSDRVWNDVRRIVEHVCDVWDEPDASIWEFRDTSRHFVHSKLLCWVALDRGLKLADEYESDVPIERWSDTRDAVKRAILERGYSESAGSFVQHFETDTAVSATSLLIPLYGLLPPDDQRVQNTLDTVLDRLTTEDGLVYRFVDSDVHPDEETAFVLCSFWLVDALALAGRVEEARSIYADVVEQTTPLALLSEKVDPETGDRLGNFPQAYSHIGLINSAVYLAQASDRGWRSEELPAEPEEMSTGF